jgi:hypothetical protein
MDSIRRRLLRNNFAAWIVLGLSIAVLGAVESKDSTDRSLKETEKVSEASSKELTPDQWKQRVERLMDSLILANAEAELFRQQWQDLRLRNEALGVDALTVDEKKLQDKVVQAVTELYQTEKQRREGVALLEKLTGAGQDLIKSGKDLDPTKRAEYEAVLRSVREYIAGKGASPVPIGPDLNNGQIVSISGELSLVIINLGNNQGVKVGMPFRVLRNDSVIGRVKIFEVREQVSAALIDLENKNELKVGDRVSVAAEK